MTLKSYLKQDNVAPHNFILFELDFNAKFPLLGLLLFLIDLKSTIITLTSTSLLGKRFWLSGEGWISTAHLTPCVLMREPREGYVAVRSARACG